MPRTKLIICFFCNEDNGEHIEATHSYQANDGNWYDVCDKHAETVKEAKLDLIPIPEEDRVETW